MSMIAALRRYIDRLDVHFGTPGSLLAAPQLTTTYRRSLPATQDVMQLRKSHMSINGP